ncbi:hypothetical protein [Kitasatospora cheerisanensis]|nr:hypothetical protein [Kitasatospora cheerisanensis]
MTVEVKHQPQRGRIARTGDGPAGTDHAAGADHAAGPEHAGGSEHVADLAELCRSVAELVRAGARPPRRIRLEHLGTAVEVEWDTPAAPAGPGTADRPRAPSSRPRSPRTPTATCAPR